MFTVVSELSIFYGVLIFTKRKLVIRFYYLDTALEYEFSMSKDKTN